jgi:hypothetical protein
MSLPFISKMSGETNAVADRGAAEKVMYEFPVVLALPDFNSYLAVRTNVVACRVELFLGHAVILLIASGE